MNQNVKKVNISFNEKAAEEFSNLVITTNSDSEFILDFARFLPGNKTAGVHTRIIMTPKHAKLLYRALGNNLTKYEEQFGAINIPDEAAFPDRPANIDDDQIVN